MNASGDQPRPKARRRGRRRRRGPDHPRGLGELVSAVYPSREPEEIAAQRAFGWWARTVPERVARNVRPVRLRRGVLTLHAATSVWAQEIDLARDTLLRALRQRAPSVRELRIQVGPLPDAPPRFRRPAPPPPVTPVAQLPDDLARALSGVPDDRLRDAIGEAAAVAIGRKEASRGGKPP